MSHRVLQFTLVSVLCALLAACGTGSSSGDKGLTLDDTAAPPTEVTTTQSGGMTNDSSFSLRLTDAPIDNLVRAVVQFTGVELKLQSGGWVRFNLDIPQSIDLMRLQGGNTANLLINVATPAGDYNEIRLYTGSGAVNYVEEIGGGIEPLQIPGGAGAGLRLRQDFTVNTAQTGSFIIDFDLRQSIRSPGNSGNYQFHEVMRLVTVSGVGGFRGEVDPIPLANGPPACSDSQFDTFNAAYVFTGHNVVPDDINLSGNDIEPITTTLVNYDSVNGKHIYEVAFLPAGDYTVAVTCNANLDDLNTEEDLQFFDIKNITVIENNVVFL